MGRTLMYIVLAMMIAFVASVAFLIDNGGGNIGAAEEVELHDLTLRPDDYRGHVISTVGTLYRNPARDTIEITSGDQNFPVVIEYGGSIEPYIGAQVHITGKFSIVPGIGPVISKVSVRPVGEVTPTPKDI